MRDTINALLTTTNNGGFMQQWVKDMVLARC